MSVKNQWNTIKENWLIVLVLLIVVAVLTTGGGMTKFASSVASGGYGYASMDYAMEEAAYGAPMMAKSSYRGGGDFAPEVEERKITKTTSMTSEVERGTFKEAEAKLKNIVTSSDSFLLNENVNKYDNERRKYYQGRYSIKVEVGKYDSVISQLKDIGEVESFSEDMDDITGSYTNIEIELEVAEETLARYRNLYGDAEEMNDKIRLSNMIASQERTVKYYKDRLANMDNKVEYSTISVTLKEEQSEYLNVVFVKFSQLVRSLVNSINSVLTLLFVVLPYVIVIGLIVGIVKFFRRKRK